MKSSASCAVAVLCLLACCVSPARAVYCWVDAKKDFNDIPPLVLQANTNEFAYPARRLSNDVTLPFYQDLRLVCPQDTLTVFSRTLAISESLARCYGLSFFNLVGTGYVAPFKRIGCSRAAVPEANVTLGTCANGTIAQIGYRLPSAILVPTIDQICHNETLAQTNWVHHRVIPSIRKRQTEIGQPAYMTGPFYANISMSSSLYTRDTQRARLQTLLNSTALVDAIIAAAGTDFLVEGMLAPRSDMFYRVQQDSTFFYINTVPMWRSIRDGNWRLVEQIVRKVASGSKKLPLSSIGSNLISNSIASSVSNSVAPSLSNFNFDFGNSDYNLFNRVKKGATLDVWTGGIDVLTYNDANGNATQFTLADNNGTAVIPVPRYLFKYVVDQSHNRGLVFITLNNPTAVFGPTDQLCDALSQCTQRYPQFNQARLGYTYCCAIDSTSRFTTVATSLGLPLYPSALPLSV